MLTENKLNNINGFNFFDILDRYGEFGHKISRFARDFIKEKIQKYFEKLKITTHKERNIYEINKRWIFLNKKKMKSFLNSKI